MSTATPSGPPHAARSWLAVLKDFTSAQQALPERCECCGHALPTEHEHLISPGERHVRCACTACALQADAARGAYRRIPHDVEVLASFRMSDAQWDAFRIPIGLAFFCRGAAAGEILAMYPGPAGAVESLLSLDAWHALQTDNPRLEGLRPEVEALLVYRLGASRRYYRVPIDRCYSLTGLIRQRWRGVSGGGEVEQAIEEFLANLEHDASRGAAGMRVSRGAAAELQHA